MYKFENIRALGLAVEAARPHPKSRCSSGGINPDFYGSLTFKEAVAAAKSGGYWPEGANNLLSVELKQSDIENELSAPALISALAGFAPLVPAFLAGQPDNMLAFDCEPTPARVLRLSVECTTASAVSSEAIFNRGRAILAVIVELEKQGYSISLDAHTYSVFIRKSAANLTFETCVTLKNAGESLSPSALTFPLCNAAYSRRCIFRLKEACPTFYRATTGKNGYGRVIPSYKPHGYNAHFPCIDEDHQLAYETPQKALKTIKTIIERALSA